MKHVGTTERKDVRWLTRSWCSNSRPSRIFGPRVITEEAAGGRALRIVVCEAQITVLPAR